MFCYKPTNKCYLIVGSGFSGAVLSRCLVESIPGLVCEVWEEREHIGGNCHTERDSSTGIMVHVYGPHIFNTNNEEVWRFINSFGVFRPYINRVKTTTERGVFSLPINLLTLNQFFNKKLTPSEAKAFLATKRDSSIGVPKNFEEQALKSIGFELYENFFKGYTIKQWGCDPKDLPASFFKRLPIRFNYDDNYYDKTYQGIPIDGYTEIIRRILDHPRIVVYLNKTFSFKESLLRAFDHIFYTGPLDRFFDYSLGRLGYRTIFFERVDTKGEEDYQGVAVMNYPDLSTPWTRVHEHKHFTPWESHSKTVAFKEYSKETTPEDIPYYPKRLNRDKTLLLEYRQLAKKSLNGVSFLGRLGTYRYMDMETVIGEALNLSQEILRALKNNCPFPLFPNHEKGEEGFLDITPK